MVVKVNRKDQDIRYQCNVHFFLLKSMFLYKRMRFASATNGLECENKMLLMKRTRSSAKIQHAINEISETQIHLPLPLPRLTVASDVQLDD